MYYKYYKYTSENITRRSNLGNNDNVSVYFEYICQQNLHAFEQFYKFIETVKPKRILEIGTGIGGFTMFLKHACVDLGLNIPIVTYDLQPRSEYKELAAEGIVVKLDNVFGENYKTVDQSVIDFIQQQGITLVLCDGEYKIGEFNILSDYIKPDDFIMAHDYAPTQEFFNTNVKGKLWNWLEITDYDIQSAVDRNKLIPFDHDKFVQAVWVCKRKKL